MYISTTCTVNNSIEKIYEEVPYSLPKHHLSAFHKGAKLDIFSHSLLDSPGPMIFAVPTYSF